MKNWKKTSLITTLIVLLLLIITGYIFSITLSWPSSDIEFSPTLVSEEATEDYPGQKPQNIILFMADGMGFGHLSLALQTQQQENNPSVWGKFEVKGWHDPRSAYGPLTDSEASATAIATGTSTSFGYIGVDEEGKPLQNIMELASDLGYNTGIVTDSYIWDGTPAAFGAHTKSEDDARDIITQMASGELDVLFGELEDLGEGDVPEEEETLSILRKRFQLLDHSLSLPNSNASLQPIAAIFAEDEVQDLNSTPNLLELTQNAIAYLNSNNKPFVLLVECEELDSASHTNDTDRTIQGLKSIQETLAYVLNFAKNQGQTLVVFTADHETGGLAALADFGSYPKMQVRWSTKDHSGAVVPLFAHGPGAQYFEDVYRNREIGQKLKKLLAKE